MESRANKSGGVGIAKRNRSLDLKSIYINRVSDSVESKKKSSKENDQKNIKKSKRSKKEVSLSSFESDLKKSRIGDADELKPDVGISQSLSGGSKGLHGISVSLAENGNNFNIPKRPRGSMGRKRLDTDEAMADEASKPLRLSDSVADVRKLNAEAIKPESEIDTKDQLTRSVTIVAGKDGASNSKLAGKDGSSNSKLKQKANSKFANRISSKLKLKQKAWDDRSGRPCSVGDAENEFDVSVNNGCESSKKRLTNSRKKKDTVDGTDRNKEPKKKLEPSVGNSVSDRVVDFDEDDDDEENLEKNAARMLSSRFDPSCTGFSSKRKSSASQKTKGSNFSVSSTCVISEQQANSSGGVDSGSDDDQHRADDYDSGRALRPRREDKGKGVARKRRHFYDILPEDLDPLWFLERKIKVFWPLDESWYFGVVTDYHPDCKLFHIKYADGDDEWIDLQEEKFKLLLFPSEIPRKAKLKKSWKAPNDVNKVEMVTPDTGDRCRENTPDSEPIASWLARSSHPGKSSPKSLETPRTTQMELLTVSSFSYEKAININSKSADPKGTRSKGDCKFASVDKPVTASVNGIHAVYVRKKNRKSEAFRSASMTVNPVTSNVSLPTAEDDKLCYRFGDSDKQLWSIDHRGKLRLTVRLESKKFRYQVCLPLLPSKSFSIGVGYLTWLHDKWMIQHMAILPAAPAVALEMLFMDTYLGLKFLLFDGCMKLAMAFIFQILNFFSKPDELLNRNMQTPVTSIRFRLSSVQDVRKHHVFEFHCFSRLQSSEWVCLDSRLQDHCLLLRQLSVSECTYENIKELEHGSVKQCKPDADIQLSSHLGFNNQSVTGILPMGISKEACTTGTHLSTLDLAKKIGNIFISFSATPTIFLMLHLRLLMENTFSIPHLELVDVPLGGKASISIEAFDTDCRVNKDFATIPNPGGPGSGSTWKSGRSHTSAVQNLSSMRPARTPKLMRIGFNGPKKPRTKVQYTMPDAGYDFCSKQKLKNQSALPCKRIRKVPVQRMLDGTMDNQKNFDLLACGANVLITIGDHGWRECGALVVLEVADPKEWKLSIKLSGVTRYSYRVKHILQPGTTNRHTHAMMWKGGKDWLLEFPDRSQWNVFKEMYEECYNRNIRAASVKNIPIPGVKLIDQSDDYGSEVRLFQHSTEYFKQVQTDAEMALDPLHILYDMDTDDELWLMENGNSNDENGCEEMSNELLEKTMDIFEKVSYVQHRDNFTDTEIEEIVNGLVSVEAAKHIFKYWQEKRRRMGLPLIRHLQPPLWQQYQQQLKEWEKAIGRRNSAISVATQQKVLPLKKPPMFAFCLKPRNLDVPSRGSASKQRSHRRFPVSRNHDGKRSYSHIFGDEKLFYPNSIHDLLDFPPSLWSSSMRMLSPRDTHFSLSTNSKSKRRKRIYTHKRRNVGRFPLLNSLQVMACYPRTISNGNRVMPWNMGLPYSSSHKPYYLEQSRVQGLENINVSDLDDLQLRDASSAARYALEIAKLKREKAFRLFDRADVAIHKAVAALMTADAIRAAYENSNGDVGDRRLFLHS